MVEIAYEYKFIFSVLIFYGFLYLLYSLNGNSLYDLSISQMAFNAPTSWADYIPIGLNFFAQLFILPFVSGWWAIFGFLNLAIFGTTLYIVIRVIRGGG